MNAGALITILKKYKPDALILMSSDSEGNNFSPLDTVISDHYNANNEWRPQPRPPFKLSKEGVFLYPLN